VIYRVRHRSEYEYAGMVDLASHLLHLRPRSLPGQRVLSARITADPAPARQSDAADHFGNTATWLFIDRPHGAFAVTAEALVDVCFPTPPDATPPWETVAAEAAWSPAAEFLFDGPLAIGSEALRAYVIESFPPGCPVLEGVLALNVRINDDFAFDTHETTIATPVSQVLAQRAGVCQDFAHLMCAGLRTLGLPARYVSGYIRTRPPPGRPRLVGADQSHAWVGCWIGSQGWVDVDPTNAVVVREEHVVLGWGRDYADVSPTRGVILGGGKHALEVSVDLAPG
jgi:transglutaminase-like putative cysteine protease